MQKTNKSRRFTGGGRSDRKKQKQEEATGENGRNTLYSKLTIQQKIDRLPPLPLCAKQHAKLQAQLDGKKKSSITQEAAHISCAHVSYLMALNIVAMSATQSC